MNQTQLSPKAHANALDQSDRLCPIPAVRQDTGELVWIVQGCCYPSCSYVLRRIGDAICCPCPHYQYKVTCAHAAVVDRHLKASKHERGTQVSNAQQSLQPLVPRKVMAEVRATKERQRREEAWRHEWALLWTDDQPFSIWT